MAMAICVKLGNVWKSHFFMEAEIFSRFLLIWLPLCRYPPNSISALRTDPI